jgi:hypothetical protein
VAAGRSDVGGDRQAGFGLIGGFGCAVSGSIGEWTGADEPDGRRWRLMAMTGDELRIWLLQELEVSCEQIRSDVEIGDEVSALVHRGEMHAMVRVLRIAVDGVDMGAVFDLVALTVGEADLHISEIAELDSQPDGDVEI